MAKKNKTENKVSVGNKSKETLQERFFIVLSSLLGIIIECTVFVCQIPSHVLSPCFSITSSFFEAPRKDTGPKNLIKRIKGTAAIALRSNWGNNE